MDQDFDLVEINNQMLLTTFFFLFKIINLLPFFFPSYVNFVELPFFHLGWYFFLCGDI